MKNRSYYLLSSLLITTISLYASDYEDYENTIYTDDDDTEHIAWNGRWEPIEDIPENSQVSLLIEAHAPLEHIMCVLDLTPKSQSTENQILHIAIKHRHVPLVEELLRRNADVNYRSPSTETPLHTATASREENMLMVQQLIQHGADVNAKDLFGSTPLHNACTNGHIETVKFLLAHKADRTIKGGVGARMIEGEDINDYTPAWTAARRGFLEIADLINNWQDIPEIKEPDPDA
jgi:ankyrin repeat protein